MFVQRAQAWNDSLARVAVQLAPAPRRFACARALAHRARGRLRITVKPNERSADAYWSSHHVPGDAQAVGQPHPARRCVRSIGFYGVDYPNSATASPATNRPAERTAPGRARKRPETDLVATRSPNSHG